MYHFIERASFQVYSYGWNIAELPLIDSGEQGAKFPDLAKEMNKR